MAKKSKKRHGRHEKDQAGCMWSLLNIFDSRPVHSSQKLILDKKRGSKRLDGAVYSNINLESLGDSCHICKESNDTEQNESLTINGSKVSVKALMDEEMCGEQDKRPVKRNSQSLDLETEGFVVDGDVVERPKHRKNKSLTNVDVDKLVEELCGQIQRKCARNSKHGEDGDVDSSVVENRLADAAKVLVKHFADGNSTYSSTNERKLQPSKELTDALEILNTNKETFLNLLRDVNSPLVKLIQNMQGVQVGDSKLKPGIGSDMLEQDNVVAKQYGFFWRRFKGQEKTSPQKKESVDLSTIVVLKPESPKNLGDKDQTEKTSSLFTFAEFKRKFKLVMKKEPLAEQPSLVNRDKKVGVEAVSMGSPSRDHFFIERIPNSSVNFRKVDKSGKMKDGKMQLEQAPGLTPAERVSNIYIEAKKHLAEIVGNNIVDVDTRGRKVPKSLGKILSYSGYSSPTISSPRIQADVRLSNTSSDVEDIDIKLPEQVKQESLTDDKLILEKDVPVAESLGSDELPRESDVDVDKSCCKSEVPSSEDIIRAMGAASQKESDFFEISVDPCLVPDITTPDQINGPRCSVEYTQSLSLEHNTSEGDGHPSYPDSATRSYSLSGKTEDLDSMSDATSRPSPVSVLEPVFRDVDINPTGIKQFIANEPIRPRQIKFEVDVPAPMERVPSSRVSVDDDKYTIQFVKDVVQMSGLTWDELLNRSLFSDHFINPSLIDEVDFLPDLLCCDFNLLFDLINEIVIELCWLKFSCMLSLAVPSVQLNSNEQDVFSEVWKVVNWYLKLETRPPTLDQILANNLQRRDIWADLRPDCENIGIQIQEAILDEIVDEIILSYVLQGETMESLL